jgi:hypothetical protein
VAKLHPYHPVWFGNPHDARIWWCVQPLSSHYTW